MECDRQKDTYLSIRKNERTGSRLPCSPFFLGVMVEWGHTSGSCTRMSTAFGCLDMECENMTKLVPGVFRWSRRSVGSFARARGL